MDKQEPLPILHLFCRACGSFHDNVSLSFPDLHKAHSEQNATALSAGEPPGGESIGP